MEYTFNETLLKTEGVSVKYGDKQILRDVNIEIRNIVRPGLTQGQVVGLLGPSGVGKTTLFRMLAGLDKPDTGKVLIGIDQKPVKRGSVGVVAQNYPLFAHRTVWGNITVAGKMCAPSNGGGKKLTADEVKAKANSILEQFDIAEHKDKYPSQLSGGQRQRVAIAQQLMCSDGFLLMDEPFSGLDLMAQHNVARFIQDIAASDELKTFVIVTHDVSAAIDVSDHIWLIGRERDENGEIIPGARIQKEYNLIDRGLAWKEDIRTSNEFMDMLKEISEVFPTL